MTRTAKATRRTLLGASLAVVVAPAVVAQTGSWRPTRPIRIVVPAAAGGTGDLLGRILSEYCLRRWGQPVAVENKGGAGGIIGTQDVLNTPADGYSWLMGNIGPQSIAYSLYRTMPYRPDSLAPVSNLLVAPNVLVTNKSVPANTIPEFVEWLRSQDGAASYASSGPGQSTHLSAVWFLQLAGVRAIHVPYRGSGPAINDLIAGTVAFYFDNLSNGIRYVRDGALKGLGITSAQPSPQTDMVPIRTTLPALAPFDVSTWFGVFMRGGTPRAAIEEVNAAIKEMLEQDSTKALFAQMAANTAWCTPEQQTDFVTVDAAKWAGVIRAANLQIDN
jgi:tripartite-type tricarboxylate transporter receptor subunit TctC